VQSPILGAIPTTAKIKMAKLRKNVSVFKTSLYIGNATLPLVHTKDTITTSGRFGIGTKDLLLQS
jgi:hypothetical protein